MTVWIVRAFGEGINGVFDTEEKAKNYTKQYKEENPDALPLDPSDFDISEFEVE